MSCRWSGQLPHDDDECLDCLTINVIQDDPGPIVITEPCVYHGPHGEHELQIRFEETLKGSVGGWYCYTCEAWLTVGIDIA